MKKLFGIIFFTALLSSCGNDAQTSDLSNGDVWFGYCAKEGSGQLVYVGGQPRYYFTCGKRMVGSSRSALSAAQSDADNKCRRDYGPGFGLGNRTDGRPGLASGDLARDPSLPFTWVENGCHTLQDPR